MSRIEPLQEAIAPPALDAGARQRIRDRALELAVDARAAAAREGIALSLVHRFGLDSPQGIALLQLAEALPRIDDAATAQELLTDKLAGLSWHSMRGVSSRTHRAALRTLDLVSGLFRKPQSVLLSPLRFTARLAMERAIATLSARYVLGETLPEALRAGTEMARTGATFSFDMLGEAAMTDTAARVFHGHYLEAVRLLAIHGTRDHAVSVKLSALHPRFEERQRAHSADVLRERVLEIALAAAAANLSLTIDAEESDRLEFTLDVFDFLARAPALQGWNGLGLAVQAYRRHAAGVLDRLEDTARATGRRIPIRLVKGAYWDTEIKHAQQQGLSEYPVFLRKCETEVNYLICARRLFSHPDLFYPQFATHNAYSAAGVQEVAAQAGQTDFEFQRLHGMGEHLHAALLRAGLRSRIYAPIGPRRDLLPYLVRRLLENGAGNSFVRQLTDAEVPLDRLVRDPWIEAQGSRSPFFATPRRIHGQEWPSAKGFDLGSRVTGTALEAAVQPGPPQAVESNVQGRSIRNPANAGHVLEFVADATQDRLQRAIAAARGGARQWAALPLSARATVLDRAAMLLEERSLEFIRLAVIEAGKTLDDAIGEVREAVDFCRYYADRCRASDFSGRQPLGVVACISPWNFPLAIFLGQVTGSLAAGNAVLAKPAEQTPLIAHLAVRLLHEAGVPEQVLHWLPGDGKVGAALVEHSDVAGVCFTGSTAAAKSIARALAATGRGAIPLIAETGGINAMIVDSSALPEQAVRDILIGAFQSAGQRCSALRILCIQEDCAERLIEMLGGALAELRVGDPAFLGTDIGPLIDAEALQQIRSYVATQSVIAQAPLPPATAARGWFFAPTIVQVRRVADVQREVFGPVLHVVRFASNALQALIDEINSLGYGLTLGVHTRIGRRASEIAERTHIGNIYINRHQVGAVVLQQPFGGHGLSGTGPKAGGPNYLLRLSLALQVIPAEAVSLTLGEGAPSHATAEVVRAVGVAQCAWARNADRVAITQRAYPAVADIPQSLELPSIVGEDNRLFLRPRGVLLCIALSGQVDHVLASLAAGNGLVVLTGAEHFQTYQSLAMQMALSGAPTHLVRVLALEAQLAKGYLKELPIDGVMFDGGESTAHRIAAALQEREGPILPVILRGEDLYRYSIEQTVTINTAAAGGDPQLLSAAL